MACFLPWTTIKAESWVRLQDSRRAGIAGLPQIAFFGRKEKRQEKEISSAVNLSAALLGFQIVGLVADW